ncbi:MAG: hypothetical protein SVY10_07610 [Thermodesulfobacteriota bacterium]|nr:hypothetical protein [Thermodesulfobacteriota bacterium]
MVGRVTAATDVKAGYSYLVYGMNIVSEIPCPELPLGNGDPEVHIRFGRVAPFGKDAKRKALEYMIEPDRIRFSIKGAGTYAIQKGNQIVVDPDDRATADEIRFYLINSALSVAMYQKGLLVIHGSVIETPSGAVVFGGESGVGKSTLAAMFKTRRYKVLSDDVCVVSNLDQESVVWPAYPQIKLGDDSVGFLNLDMEKSPGPHQPIDNKSVIPLEKSYRNKELTLFCFYEIGKTDQSEISLKPLKGIHKFLTIMKHIYRVQILGDTAFLKQLSVMAAQTAGNIEVKKVFRPDSTKITGELADFIEKDLEICQKATQKNR